MLRKGISTPATLIVLKMNSDLDKELIRLADILKHKDFYNINFKQFPILSQLTTTTPETFIISLCAMKSRLDTNYLTQLNQKCHDNI